MDLTEPQRAVRDAVLAELEGSFGGELITEDSTGYDQARTLWNAVIDKRPALIARCTNTEDVVAVVNAARVHDALLSVRGGGHGVVGKALADDGVTLDLGLMNGVTVDTERKLVHVQGGCRLGDVDAATSEHGLAVPAGIVADTGVGGLTLGGGAGWLSRKYGLTSDNVVSFEAVTASGDVLEVSATEHPDLIWALHGGGGNFGVVTRFTFRAYAFGPDVRFGAALYTADTAAVALRAYADIYPTLPYEVGWHVTMKQSMPPLPFVPDELVGKRLVMIFCLWAADVDDAEGTETIKRLVGTGDPVVNTVAAIPFGLGLQRFLDAEYSDGLRNYTNEAHLTELSDDVIEALLDFWEVELAGPESSIGGEPTIYGLGGAVQDVPEAATAFSHSESVWWVNYACHWKDARDDERNMAAIRSSCRDLTPWLGAGIYVNMLNVDELDRVVEAYGGPETYARLGVVKAKYDPGNLFRVNHNIVPSTA
ncbi:FAD-binding oxidoreductase [Streptomyces sp. NPDC096311]|uniref:FAD-binding oxidoreductase n=1 Tax=Streptomyces sp. NPDC096311 TaxID=3366083 RepID=UPI0037FF6B4C